MNWIEKNREFDRFCLRLEELKGSVPVYETGESWVTRVLAEINRIRPSDKEQKIIKF